MPGTARSVAALCRGARPAGGILAALVRVPSDNPPGDCAPRRGRAAFTHDKERGGGLGPAWLLVGGGVNADVVPDRVGGHQLRTLVGERADWLRARVAEGPFTGRGLTAELAGRGIKTERRAVWVFLHVEGLSLGKPALPAEQSRPGITFKRGRWQTPRARSARAGWSSLAKPGSRPAWRRCAAGACAGNDWARA
jgi:hypothetical protein